MRRSVKLNVAVLQRVAIAAVVGVMVAVSPVLAITLISEPSVGTLPTVETVRETLEARLDSLKDIRTVVTLTEYNRKTQAVVNVAEVEIQAVTPSVARLTVRRPDLYKGSVFVLDQLASEVWQYSPLYDRADCMRPEQFVASFPFLANVEALLTDGLFSVPSDEDFSLAVVRTEMLNGLETVVLQVQKSQDSDDAGLDEIIDDLRSELGLSGEVEADDILYIWVDLAQRMVRQMKVYSAEGVLVTAVETNDVRMDQGLTAQGLKTFRGAELRRCR